MSFGFSVGDFVALIQLAKKTYKNCVEAGSEYNDIAREIRSLYSVLKPLRDEAGKPDSGLFRQDQASAEELKNGIDGCNHILEDLQILLAKYEGLSTAGEPVSTPKKLWHRFRFSTKIEQLAAVRAKLISYTSTISVLLDTVQLRATGRVENKIDNVSSQMAEGFESLKKVILDMAVKARVEQRGGSTLSLLSLSTYAGDDKEIWQEFRRELIGMGFRSKALDRHKDLLQAYMLKLDQSGVLDEVEASSGQNTMEPWWKKHAFSETVNTLPGLQPIGEEASAVSTDQLGKGKTPTPPPPEYSVIDVNKGSLVAKSAPSVDQEPIGPKARRSPGLQNINEVHTPESELKSKSPALPSGVAPPHPSLTLDSDSEESEKETTVIRRPWRRRIKREPEHESLDAVTSSLAANISTTTPSQIPRNSEPQGNVSAGGSIPQVATQTVPSQINNLPRASLTKNEQIEAVADTVYKTEKAFDQPSERRKERKDVRGYATVPARQNLVNPLVTSTKERERPAQTNVRSRGTIDSTNSPKSKRATPRTGQARPFPSHAHSDPVPRFGSGYRPPAQRRPISETSRNSKTSNLGAVAFGLAGLSLILGMRRKNKIRDARSRSDTDGYFSYYSDSYTQTSDSDDDESSDEYSDDEDPPKNGRRNLEDDWYNSGTRYSRGRQRAVPRTTGGGKNVEGGLGTQPLNASADVSGSDVEVPGVKPSNSCSSLRAALGVNSGPSTSTQRENTRTNEAAKTDMKSNQEMGAGSTEKLASAETADKATEAGPSGGQEENLERRFVISSRT